MACALLPGRSGVGRTLAVCVGLAVAVVAVGGPRAFGANPSVGDVAADGGPAITTVNGVSFAWPALDSPSYAEPGTAPFRRAIGRWRDGERPRGIPATPRTPTERYLAADVIFLDASANQADWFVAIAAYERALRETPEFPDASRARFMRGEAYLALGLAPEAASAFQDCARGDPEGPWAIEARIGFATALARSRREAEARRVLDGVLGVAQGPALCRAHAAATSLSADPVRRAEAFRSFAAACPDALVSAREVREYVEALAGAGDVDGARRVLAAPRESSGDVDEEARLHLLAGVLAPDPDAARLEYEHVLGAAGSPALALEAHMRLALLEGRDDPAKRASALGALLTRPAPTALRAEVLGEAADASSRAGRFEEALARLDQLAGLGPDAMARADARRATVLGRWIADLERRGDPAGVATVYAAYTTELESGASVEDRLRVARALGQLGLHGAAAGVLARSPVAPPEVTATLGEESLAAGDEARARAAAERLLADRSAASYADRARILEARAELAVGDVDGAAEAAEWVADLALRGEIGAALLAREDGAGRASALLRSTLDDDRAVPVRTLLATGSAAVAEGAFDVARAAYRRALDASAVGPERAEAAAGLARAAHAVNDGQAAAAALAEAAGTDPEDRLFARIAVAARRAAARTERGHGR